MDFNLDFTIETSKDRKNFIASKDLSKLTQKEIELCSNYILYGKEPDKDNTSVVDRKEVQIKTKFSSYSRQEPLSLDMLLESPTFNEAVFKKNPTIYKKPKTTIDKEKVKDIPGMEDLWNQIKQTQDLLEQNKGENKTLSNKKIYYLKHYLIELRRQQYYLMDSAFQTLPPPQNKAQYFQDAVDTHLNYRVYPRGVMSNEHDKEFKEPRLDKTSVAAATDRSLEDDIKNYRFFINFADKNHIYQLILFYWDIKMAICDMPDSPLNNLLWTLDFYIEKANLTEQQALIVRDKKLRLLNQEIARDLKEELGIYHQENYISTIWNKTTQQIADAATLNYDEWLSKDFNKAWKKCNYCGKELLRDSRNFIRKTKAADGLTNRCKCCDKKLRKGR